MEGRGRGREKPIYPFERRVSSSRIACSVYGGMYRERERLSLRRGGFPIVVACWNIDNSPRDYNFASCSSQRSGTRKRTRAIIYPSRNKVASLHRVCFSSGARYRRPTSTTGRARRKSRLTLTILITRRITTITPCTR